MTDHLDLDHLDALHAAATPGPWHLTDSSAIVAPLTADVWEPTAASRNGEFIEAAREALPALVAEVRRLRAQVVDLGDENAKLIRWHREDGAYEQRLREQHDRDVAELSSVRAERDQARARIAELERPAVEAKRNEIRQSYSELIAQCEQDRDFEGAFDVQCRLREREEQWAAEDAANQPAAPAARSAAV